MGIRSEAIRTVATVVAAAAATVTIAGYGSAASGHVPVDAKKRTGVAPYQGDPWEARFRTAFWTEQHIHDSWNRCHIGENAPSAPGC